VADTLIQHTILMLSSHLTRDLKSSFFPSSFPTKLFIHFLHFVHVLQTSPHHMFLIQSL